MTIFSNMNNITKNLTREFETLNSEMFRAEWRKAKADLVLRARRYTALLKWIDKTICGLEIDVKCFNPADKTDGYTKRFFKQYCDSMGQLAVLVQFRMLLQDPKCTEEQAKNIGYTIDKMFNVYYDCEMDYYMDRPRGDLWQDTNVITRDQ